MDIKIFQNLGETIDSTITAYVDPGAASLISMLRITAVTGVGLYFTCMGYMIMTGAIQESFYTFLKQCTKVMIIAALALNADIYSTWVVEAFHGLESGLSTAMSKSDKPESIYGVLDAALGKGMDLVSTCLEKAGSSTWHVGKGIGWFFSALAIGTSSTIITVLGAASIISAKFSLAVMFAIGPLFIMCLMWPVTARFFNAWFSKVINYILSIVIMVIVMSFAVKCFELAVSVSDVNAENPMIAAFKIMTTTLVLMFLIRQVGSMAAGLSGGLSIAALTVTNLARDAVSPVTAYRDVRDFKNDITKKEKIKNSETPACQKKLIENLQNGFQKK